MSFTRLTKVSPAAVIAGDTCHTGSSCSSEFAASNRVTKFASYFALMTLGQFYCYTFDIFFWLFFFLLTITRFEFLDIFT